MTTDNPPRVRDYSLLFPLLVGIFSLLGICLLLGSVWFPRQKNTQGVPTQSIGPLKLMILATRSAIPEPELEITSSPEFLPTAPRETSEGEIAPLPTLTSQSGNPTVGIFTPTITTSASTEFIFTPAITTSVSSGPTKTVRLSERCKPPSPEFLEAVGQVVESFNPNNHLETAWVVRSTDQVELWFIAAKINGPTIVTGATLPGVWALLFYSEGYSDVYSINNIATEYSDSAWGEGSDPAITMQIDGAQEAYECALSEN